MSTTISHGGVRPHLESRIAAHVHAWEQLKRAPEHPHEKYPFITISREYGCEGAALARHLSELLNERCRPTMPWVSYDHELLDKVAKELHLRREVVDSLDGRRRDEMSELFDTILNKKVDDSVVIHKLAEVVRSLAVHGHAILVGRGSALITQDLKTGLHVRLVAQLGWRAHKIQAVRNLSYTEAEKVVIEGEQQRERYIRTFYVQDDKHVFHPDLVIENSRFNLAQIAEIVFTALSARFGEILVGA